MSLAASTEKLLPYLRRYARALTGSQTRGDDLVADAISNCLEVGEMPPHYASVRAWMYGVLSELIASQDEDQSEFGPVTSLSRRALLLVAMEGLSDREVQSALGIDASALEETLAQAEREMESLLAARIFIIEDEPLITAHLKQTVEALGHRVVGEAANQTEALNRYQAEEVDLILSDIRLSDDSSGIDTVDELNASSAVPVIFITAYPEKLLAGAGMGPCYIIPKPYRGDHVKAVIAQALLGRSLRPPLANKA